ncbi:MAG: CDGSH iron-sulfur domain-containing protein [Myxococcales bacterium]|nr:CDGSH iron-sulfur domain-containing protein [Myxococcales bacterium]
MSDSKVTVYPGQSVDVSWDGRLCIHVGECGRAAGSLFEGGRKPWCDPDVTSADAVQAVVERCPSGALSAVRKDGGPREAPPPTNTIHVANNGPLYVTGELNIDGARTDQPGLMTRAALCRCGQSANKPFCDGSHERVGFVDRGAIGEVGSGLAAEGGELNIRRAPNGPLLVSGNVTVVAGSGRAAWRGAKAALCRCGGSANKPFCDGTHRAIGFQAE